MSRSTVLGLAASLALLPSDGASAQASSSRWSPKGPAAAQRERRARHPPGQGGAPGDALRRGRAPTEGRPGRGGRAGAARLDRGRRFLERRDRSGDRRRAGARRTRGRARLRRASPSGCRTTSGPTTRSTCDRRTGAPTTRRDGITPRSTSLTPTGRGSGCARNRRRSTSRTSTSFPGAWTRIRIEVRGDRARLFVHGSEQPTLVVNDVKSGANAKGAVALWLGPGTVAHFRNLTIRP